MQFDGGNEEPERAALHPRELACAARVRERRSERVRLAEIFCDIPIMMKIMLALVSCTLLSNSAWSMLDLLFVTRMPVRAFEKFMTSPDTCAALRKVKARPSSRSYPAAFAAATLTFLIMRKRGVHLWA